MSDAVPVWRGMLLASMLAAVTASAADTQPSVLPTLRFTADVVASEFYDQIQRAPQFQKMSREAVGSPLELRVYHTWRINRGSAEATGLLAAATLGIVPMVSSGEHTIVYELLVNGAPVSAYKYSKSLTHAHNLWSGADTTHGLGKDGVEWAKSTVALFLKDAADDAKLAALAAEFDYYFSPPKT